PRSIGEVEVEDRPVRVKIGPGRVKAEFDDAARVAAATGRPVRSVLAEAEARWSVEYPAEPVGVADGVIAELVEHSPDHATTHHHHHDDDHDHTHTHTHTHDHDHDHDHRGRLGDPDPDQPSA
ncbi:MAG: DUF111 family protein, partial [Acidimicrobiales bacterium]|nr:DUF111 family protein [Acidimicrobiales bacterium]